MNRLITFGCSNTFGQALEDCWDYETNQPVFDHPSKFAWPSLLAKKLDLECHNHALPGASNKLIMNQIISFPFAPNDTVVIMWSYSDRYHIFTDPKKNCSTETIGHWQKNRRAVTYYRQIYNENDQKIMTNHYIDYTALYLDKHKITNFHTTCDRRIRNSLVFNIDHDMLRFECPRALDGSHAGPEAHKEMANRIYKGIST